MAAHTADKSLIYRLVLMMAQAKVFAVALLWLMIILITGTIAEKMLGIYQAQQLYFSSYIIWLGDTIPLPGLLTMATFIFIALFCKLALSPWRWRNLGTIIVHVGALILLLGGFLAAHFSAEGVMTIPPGMARDYMEDYHHVDLAVTELNGQERQLENVFSEDQLKAGSILGNTKLPFEIKTVSWCSNCDIARLSHPLTDGHPHGVAINFILKALPHNPVEEQNRSGLTFRLQNAGEKDGLYAIYESMPIPEIITVAGKKYLLAIRPVRTYLPFSIKLVNFRQDFYPGTDKPRAYQSDVILQDHGIIWHSLIGMNEPLRYKGYTFYQSSFLQDEAGTATVLAVVKNIGRLFPYISGVIITIGLLIHLMQGLCKPQHIKSKAP